jgi:hypothetical protein
MELEKMWYEASPFIYTAAGGFLIGRGGSALLIISGILLLTAGGTIMTLRRRYTLRARDENQKAQAKPAARRR